MSAKHTPQNKPMRAVWFTRTKNGLRAYYWSPLQFRSFPMPVAEAERMVLNGEARMYARNPFDFSNA